MTVTIVGRPNVGKSTLFNRIVRKRVAITLQESGTTRDRISTQAEWNNNKFTLIDTGGYITEKEEVKKELSQKVNFQIEQAIKSADVIIFLVDGSNPLLAQDFTIAEILRKSNKPYVLAVNKTDIKATKDNLYEFYKLGAKQLYPISAEHDIGVDDLLDEVVGQGFSLAKELRKPTTKTGSYREGLPYEKQAEPIHEKTKEHILRLLIIGRPNVGKSLFLNRILNQERAIVSEIPGTTRDIIEEEFVFNDKKYRIIDTAGLRKKPKVTESVEYFSVQRAIQHIPKADVVILLLDGQSDTFPPVPLTKQDKNIVQLVLDRGKPMVIAVNKMDLFTATEQKKLLNNTKMAMRNFIFIPVLPMSVLKNKGMDKVIKKAQDVYEAGLKKVTDELIEQTIAPTLDMNPPSSKTKHLQLKQTGILPPRFDLITNVPKDVTEIYQRYVINQIRDYFGFMGNPIRLEVKRKGSKQQIFLLIK